MNQRRILDAVWSMCCELECRDHTVRSTRWNGSSVLQVAAGCVLASQVPHAMAVAAVERLGAERLLPTSDFAVPEAEIAAALRTPLTPEYPRAYRFPTMAARRLARLSSEASAIVDLTLSERDSACARRHLTGVRCGLGPKQSSLLLCTVRTGANLAVLDVHTLSFMRTAGLSTLSSVPSSLRSYERLEERFRDYAAGLRVSLDRLDTAVWIVMRAAGSKGAAWRS